MTPCCVPGLKPRASSVSRVMSDPARPLALSATSLPSRASQARANMSPPIPVMCGSVTLRTAAAVTAASIALPPCRSTSSPAADASGWLVAIIACGAYTTDRPASVVGRCAAIGETANSAAANAAGQRRRRSRTTPSAPSGRYLARALDASARVGTWTCELRRRYRRAKQCDERDDRRDREQQRRDQYCRTRWMPVARPRMEDRGVHSRHEPREGADDDQQSIRAGGHRSLQEAATEQSYELGVRRQVGVHQCPLASRPMAILPSFSAPALSVDDVSYSSSTARSSFRSSNRPSREIAVSSQEPSIVSAAAASLSGA